MSASEEADSPRDRARSEQLNLRRHGREIAGAVHNIASEIEIAAGEVERLFRRCLHDRTLSTLGGAAGVGFVLGGGLTPRMTAMAIAWGSRLGLAFVAQNLSRPQRARAAPTRRRGRTTKGGNDEDR